MLTRFRDRTEAGRLLAKKLTKYAHRTDVLVLALPRGGVPVGYEVARALHAPLDVFVVRKLGVPGHEELAMGAIATGGARVRNERVLSSYGISEQTLAEVAAREGRELERRERVYRGDRPAPTVRDRTVILVDDGIATGATMGAAISALRQQEPTCLAVAVPTIARDTWQTLERSVDDLIAVLAPEHFHGVGQWYADFSQTTDEEVRELLARAQEP